ncbi:MAG: hypothetical protein EA396_13400 [Anaerolineaceae bacterium]|nr:MAG: hypothetical protein EA396_13400 [Anaerolineaceae bacterium]
MKKNRILWLLLALLLSTKIVVAEENSEDISAILNGMTLEQKIGQMFLVSIYGETLNFGGRELIETWQPGGVTLFGSNAINPTQITELTNSYQQTITEAGGVPLFIATDQEGGIITRLRDGFAEWPSPALLTASGDAELAFRIGERMGQELRAVGVNMNLAPVADLDSNVNNPIIGRRSPGSHLDLLRVTLPAYIEGLQSAGVAATTKHFPGHGDTDEDSHLTLPVIHADLDTLYERELQPFISAISAGTSAIMMAHIWFSELDEEVIPASLSPRIVTDLLRDELGYEGIIMTDAMEMNAITSRYRPEESALMAIEAGVDMLAFGTGMGAGAQSRMMQALVDAVRAGDIAESRIDESVRRILTAKAYHGILDWSPLDSSSADVRINVDESTQLIDSLFRAGVTLAFDHGELLPVTPDQTLLLLYPSIRPRINWTCHEYRQGGQWSSVPVFSAPSDDDINAAIQRAEHVDVVIVFTDDARDDRAYQRLVNALPQARTVAVALRSPYDLLTYPDVAAYLITYSPQNPAIDVACAIIFGEMTAQGTISVNLPILSAILSD